MSEASKKLDDNLRKLSAYVIPNAAVRAFIYNAAGIDKMDNRSFRPDEIKQAADAWHNAQRGRQTEPIKVTAENYAGNVVGTGSKNPIERTIAPIRNVLVNPMRMTTGTMWVAPNGQMLSIKNGEFYEGEPYDFRKSVQSSNEYSAPYKAVQYFSTKIRELQDKPSMTMDLNLKEGY